MASSITFSGFNDIDFGMVLNALMQQASAPLNALQQRQGALESQVKTFNTLSARVSAVRAASAALDDVSQLSGVSGQSSNPSAVSVSAGSSAQPASYDVVITKLARAQVTASASTFPDSSDTIVAGGGSITIAGVQIPISGGVTLDQLIEEINNVEGLGVTASAVRTGPSAYRLALSGTLSGADNAFTVVNNLTGGVGLSFTDTDNNGITGDSAADNAVNASNAEALVNNLAVTNSSNVFADVLPGVTFTAYQADPDETIQLTVSPDSTALKTKVGKFISAYNDMVKFLDEQRVAAGNGDASSIGRDPLLRQIRNTLRTELLGAHGSETMSRLSEIGVEFTQAGTLDLNETLFDTAVETDGDAVKRMLGDAGGVFPAVTGLLDTYTQSTGIIKAVKDRLSQQVTAMDGQIATMQARLALQREAMQKEFIAADQAMSRLKQQSGSLAGLGIGAF